MFTVFTTSTGKPAASQDFSTFEAAMIFVAECIIKDHWVHARITDSFGSTLRQL